MKDAQGTIQDIADSRGNRVQRFLYSAYGILLGIQDAQANDVTAAPLVNTSYGFTGRELDSESGLMYYRARYYDPAIGRFLQKDPELGKASEPLTVVNSHAYVANDPANLTDPTGRFIFVAIVIGAAVLSGAIAAKLNYDAAKSSGLSGWSLFGSTLLGFATGAAVAALTISMPALAPVWGAGGAVINNVGNQWIERGSLSKVNWGRAALSGIVGGAVAWALGGAFNALPGVNRVLTAEGQALISGPIGSMAGYCVDFGFGSDQSFEVFCGVKIRPEDQMPQVPNK
jgi:RHS repeat-associated protein